MEICKQEWSRYNNRISLLRSESKKLVGRNREHLKIDFHLTTTYVMFPALDGRSVVSKPKDFWLNVFPEAKRSCSQIIKGVRVRCGENVEGSSVVGTRFILEVEEVNSSKSFQMLIAMANEFQQYMEARIDALFDEFDRMRSESAFRNALAKEMLAFPWICTQSIDISVKGPNVELTDEAKADLTSIVRWYWRLEKLFYVTTILVSLGLIWLGFNLEEADGIGMIVTIIVMSYLDVFLCGFCIVKCAGWLAPKRKSLSIVSTARFRSDN
jgi:hypothetical protein